MGQTIQGLLTRCVHGEGVDLPEILQGRRFVRLQEVVIREQE